MMHLNVRRVDIYHDSEHIYGFKFFDKNKSLVWNIGNLAWTMQVANVVLEENETIVGVAAKYLNKRNTRPVYTDF